MSDQEKQQAQHMVAKQMHHNSILNNGIAENKQE
jgi:hypothetical protein